MLTLPHLCIITSVIIFFNCVGLFGNINVIVAVLRAPTLKTKAGYLMVILCILQSICLLSELANLRIYWGRDVMEQSTCFRLWSVYIFAKIAQSLVYFMIVLDKLIAVAFPLKHKMWPKSPYIFVMSMPPLMIASAVLFASYYSVDNAELKVCRPPTVAHGVITTITILLTFTNTAAVVVMFVMLGIVIRNENIPERNLIGSRHRKTNQSIAPSVTNKTIRVTTVIVAVFVCTWYLSVASTLIALNLDLPEEFLNYVMTLIMVPMFVAYSQNFYALLACPRYSPVLKQQTAWIMTCGSREGGNSALQTTLRSSSSRIASISTSNNAV